MVKLRYFGVLKSPGDWRLLPWISTCSCGCDSFRFSWLMFGYTSVIVDKEIYKLMVK